MATITASELKYRVENAGHDSHFFSRQTMRFFGDTMRNYGVRDAGRIIDACGLVDVRVLDHVIVGQACATSMAEAGLV